MKNKNKVTPFEIMTFISQVISHPISYHSIIDQLVLHGQVSTNKNTTSGYIFKIKAAKLPRLKANSTNFNTDVCLQVL